MVPRSIACPVDQKISNPNERNGKCLNNSNEFRPACAGEDTELDSPLTGRFKRNWTVSCIIRWKPKLGHCSNWSSITGNNNKPQQQRKLMSQRFAKGGKFNGMLWECFGRVFVEHATLLFFGNVKIPWWRTSERCWLGARPKVTVVLRRLNLAEQTTCQKSKKWTPERHWMLMRCRCVKALAFYLFKCQLHLNFCWDFYSRIFT